MWYCLECRKFRAANSNNCKDGNCKPREVLDNKVIPGAYNFHNNGYMVTLGDRIDNDSELSNGTSSHSDSLEVN